MIASISDSRIIIKSLPSYFSSDPEYLPYRMVSPTLTVRGSSFLPLPIATTLI